MGMALNNFYVHCWDEGDQYGISAGGIAWRVTDPSGALINQGNVPLTGCDIDVALYTDHDTVKVLAAYFRATLGYFYNTYKIVSGVLTPIATDQWLASPSYYCGGVNVDANIEDMGLVITWAKPDSGVYVRAARYDAVFGPRYTVPGLSGYFAPDVSLGQYSGALGAGRNIYLCARNNPGVIRVISLPFDNIVTTATAIPATEGSYTSPPTFSIDAPRIDCPDKYTFKKWAVVFGDVEHTTGGTTENIRALIMNRATATSPYSKTVHRYTTTPIPYNNILSLPVLSYTPDASELQIGWMSRHMSVAYGSTGNNGRYLSKKMRDVNGTPPDTIPNTYCFIDYVPSLSVSTLSFSGQNLSSGVNGLYAAFSQWSGATFMRYKSKLWPSVTFKATAELAGPVPSDVPSIYPNPFGDFLDIGIPARGRYELTITGLDGKIVYTDNRYCEAGAPLRIFTSRFPNGLYMLHIHSAEAGIDFKTKVSRASR